MEEIKIPICYLENRIGDDVDRNGDVIQYYDFEEMADALEESIKKLLNRNVLVTISELKNEWEDE